MPIVDSSVMFRISYREAVEELDITFRSGKIYTYLGVPPEVYRDFLASESKGEFFNEHIRDSYPYARRRRR